MINFDDWEDYKPYNGEILEEVDNPNVLKIYTDTDINLLEIGKKDFKSIFKHFCEENNKCELFMRFIKSQEFSFNDERVTLFTSNSDEDSYVLKKNDDLYYFNVYQSNEYYQDDNKLTFTGWDYNIIINIENMKSKTKNIR